MSTPRTTIIPNHNPSLQGVRIVRDAGTDRPVDVVLAPVIGFAATDHGNSCFSTTPIDIQGGRSDEIVALIDDHRWWLSDGGGSGLNPLLLKQKLLAGDEGE